MLKNAGLVSPIIFLLPKLYQIYNYSVPSDLLSIESTDLVVAATTIVIVGAGLVIYFKKRNALSKKFSVVLTTVILILAISGTSVRSLGSGDSNAMYPTQLQTNLSGTTGYSIFQLADGRFILNTANHSCTFLTKLDSSYHVIWTKKIIVNQENTVLSHLLPTSDRGFALAGIVNNQYILLKTDPQGNIQWITAHNSGAPINYLRAMIQTRDGGFAIAGFGETIEEGLGWIWFAKIDSCGNMQWNKTLSGPVADCPSAIIQTSDGGYMMSDVSYSYVPDQGFFRLIKMDMHGNVLWNTTYGGEGYYLKPECNSAIATKDGGYLIVGYLWDTDAWVVKIDNKGNMKWNQTYGDKGSSITSALETQSGGYLLTSISNFKNAGLIMIDDSGNRLWNMTFPDVTWPIGYEANFNSLIQAKNGDYVMVGSKNQTVWLAKLNYQNDLPTTLQSLSIEYGTLTIVAVITLLILLKKKENPGIRRSKTL